MEEKRKDSPIPGYLKDPKIRHYMEDIASGRRHRLDLEAVNPVPPASFAELLKRLEDPNEREFFLAQMGVMKRFIRGTTNKIKLALKSDQIAQHCQDLHRVCQLFTAEQFPGLHEEAEEIKQLLGVDYPRMVASTEN